ncbi:MAG: hypothetical protein AABX00_01805 [Nanoarchaeota archaeon]
MTLPEVVNAKAVKEWVVVDYQDGSKLFIKGLQPPGPLTRIDDVALLSLYQNDGLAAFVVNQPSKDARPEDRGFQSVGAVSQQQFAEYLGAALKYFESVSETGNPIYGMLAGYGQKPKEELSKGAYKPFERSTPFFARLEDARL